MNRAVFRKDIHEEKNGPYVACSDCFSDHGLLLTAIECGTKDDIECPICKSKTGHKLTRVQLLDLASKFFVNGSYIKTSYGGFPYVQYNEHHYHEQDFKAIGLLRDTCRDAVLISELLGVGFFPYSPATYAVGFIEPLEDLQSNNDKRRIPVLNRVIQEFPSVYLHETDVFYRLRVNPLQPDNKDQYDSPPSQSTGRLDSDDVSVWYGAAELELCFHECRGDLSAVRYFGTVSPVKPLKLLNLTARIDEGDYTDFTSLYLAIQMLFGAEHFESPGYDRMGDPDDGDRFVPEKDPYHVAREIASAAHRIGFDGILYPSYFANYLPEDEEAEVTRPMRNELRGANIALFGHPVREGKIVVKSVNKRLLLTVRYSFNLGPVIMRDQNM